MNASSGIRLLWIREIQYLLMVASEAAWIYPWSLTVRSWILRGSGEILDLPSLVVILLLAVTVTRAAAALVGLLGANHETPKTQGSVVAQPLRLGILTIPAWRAVAARLVMWLVVAFGVILAALLGLAQLPDPSAQQGIGAIWTQLFDSGAGLQAGQVGGLAAVLWWRGTRLGRERPSLATAVDEFLVGLVAMSVLLALAPLAMQVFPMSVETLMISALTFLFTGLIGMPVARLVDVSRQPRHRGDSGVKVGGCWLLTLFGLLAVMTAVALVLAQIVSFDRIDALWNAVSGPISAVLTVIVYVLSRPFDLATRFLVFLFSLLPSSKKPRSTNPTPGPGDSPQPDQIPVPPEAILALKIVLVLALVALLLWLVVKALSRLGWRWEREEMEEIRDSVWTWPSPRAIWRWLLGTVWSFGARVAAPILKRRMGRRTGGNVREIYGEFLAFADGLGRGRTPPETPLEYERRLTGAISSGAEELHSITEAYVRDRYAPPAYGPADPAPLAAALARLRALWHGLGDEGQSGRTTLATRDRGWPFALISRVLK